MITAALGGKGTVTVKTGKATTKVDVEVRSAQEGGDCIVFDKSSVTIKAGKTATVKVSKPKNAGAISWSVPGSPAGISVSKNATFDLEYNETDGLLEVKSYKEPAGKKTTVNVRVYYNGNESKPVKSSLTINTK